MSESRMTAGVHLLNDLNDGLLQRASSKYLKRVQADVSEACEELIEVGARIRPLMAGELQIGWVRGVHLSERRHLARYIKQPELQVEHILRLGTSLAAAELEDMSALEVRSLFRVVEEMTRSDLRLYSFLSAYTTTSSSEQLWFSQGTSLTSMARREVELPDGSRMRIETASDHARLWATLCNYREMTKRRVDDSMNALLIVRPTVGKGADKLGADLKRAAKALVPDTLDTWRDVVAVTRKAVDLDDGWAHSEDDSIEGIRRELRGMVSDDRHERLIATIERQQKEQAEAQLRAIEEKRTLRRRQMYGEDEDDGSAPETGVVGERTTFSSSTQVAAQQEGLRRARPAGIDPTQFENKLNTAERLRKYSSDGNSKP